MVAEEPHGSDLEYRRRIALQRMRAIQLIFSGLRRAAGAFSRFSAKRPNAAKSRVSGADAPVRVHDEHPNVLG